MIVDKKSGQIIRGKSETPQPPQPSTPVTGEEEVSRPSSGAMQVVRAIEEILKNVRWEYDNPESPLIFRTVQWNCGQFGRIVRKGVNKEYAIAFPAAFVHFVQTEYLVSQQRIGEGRAKLRIQFILNRLNNLDYEHELDHLYVAERIDQEITLHKGEYECLSDRCKLQYWDFPESFDDGLQPGWLTYEIWFREEYIWHKRNVVYKHLIMPPFTYHSDQKPSSNEMGHVDADHPASYDEASRFVKSIPESESESEQ